MGGREAGVTPCRARPRQTRVVGFARTADSFEPDVHPTVEACWVPGLNNNFDVTLGFPRSPDRLPSVGDVNIAVIFVDFPDAPASATVGEQLAKISPGTETFFSTVSYGALTM